MSARSWRAYVVRQGDYLTKLGWRLGFDADTVWDHPRNADLKAKRKGMDILCPGDVVFIPGDAREELPLVKGAVNRFVAKVPKVTVTVRLRDGDTVLKDEPYKVRGLARVIEGTTDGEGVATFALPVHVREVDIELPERKLVYHTALGDMDCINEMSGVRMRLANLGFYKPPADDEDGTEALRAALAAFQQQHGLDGAGELDDATREALTKVYGC